MCVNNWEKLLANLSFTNCRQIIDQIMDFVAYHRLKKHKNWLPTNGLVDIIDHSGPHIILILDHQHLACTSHGRGWACYLAQRPHWTQIIRVCPDIWVFSVLHNRHLTDIWVIFQKCQFGVRKGWKALFLQLKPQKMHYKQADSAILNVK